LSLLAALLALALILAAIVNLLPSEWQPEVPLIPPFGRVSAGARPQDVSLVPDLTPAASAVATPQPGRGLADRTARVEASDLVRGFVFFGVRRGGVNGFTVHMASLLTLILGGLLALFLVPARLGRVAGTLRGRWNRRVRLGLLGVAGGLIVVATSILSVFTSVGIPIWLLVSTLGLVAVVLGLAAVSLPLGRWIGYRAGLPEQPALVDLLAGLLILFILNLLPFVGGLLLLLAALLGLGAVLQTRAGSERPWTFGLPDLEY